MTPSDPHRHEASHVRWIVAALTALAATVGALYLGFALLAGTTTGSCPTALLQGELVEQDGALAVRAIPEGGVSKVAVAIRLRRGRGGRHPHPDPRVHHRRPRG